MSFISNAVRLIKGKKSTENNQVEKNSSVVENSAEFDFSLRNYAKESFSVLIQKPFSMCVLKIMRGMTFTFAGVIVGTLLAVISVIVFMQFGSVENTIISNFISGKFEKIFPDAELNIKSAGFVWSPESNSFEIDMKKVRINDFLVPHIKIQPDYIASLKEQTLVTKNISITNPKITLDLSEDWKHATIDPNLGKNYARRSLFVPVNVINDFQKVLRANTDIKIINADVSLLCNKDAVNLQNVYCEYDMNSIMPKVIAGNIILPEQKYSSSFSINKSSNNYQVKLGSLNPDALVKAFQKLALPVDKRLTSMIDGYNLPVSGKIDLNFSGDKLLNGSFELSGVNGAVRLPSNNSFSLNLGKKIDSGKIYGSFNAKNAKIDALRIAYGNAGLQLNGINIPLSNYRFLNTANIDGTLSLTNIDVSEMESILPGKITTSAVAPLKACLPEFNLEMFKIDLRGPIAFNTYDNNVSALKVGQGTFTIKDAKIPLGKAHVDHVNASGVVMKDGIDIKIANANYNGIKINQGVLCISSKDNSSIGKANIDLPIKNLSQYSEFLSPKLAKLPLDKLGIKGVANLDVKIVSIQDDNFPFRVIQGEGAVTSDNNSKQLKVSWNPNNVIVSGDVNTGNNSINVQFNEDVKTNTGYSVLKFFSGSEFLQSMIPSVHAVLKGNYQLTLNTKWKNNIENGNLAINLKDATLYTPFTGNLKSMESDGSLISHITRENGVYNFSDMKFIAGNNKISGTMTVNEQGELISCNFPVFNVNDNSVKLQLIKKDKEHALLSVVGNKLNFNQISAFLKGRPTNAVSSVYMNLKGLQYGNETLRNVQGTIDFKNNSIVGGACYGVLGENTTLALSARNIKGENLTTISASNAGDFLRYFNITDSVQSGNLNIVLKNETGIGSSHAGGFEITNCIVKDCKLLNQLISLSSVNLLPNMDNLSVGFNRCIGKFIFTNKEIIVDKGVALSPSFAINFAGKYERENDILNINGSCLPMSSYYTSNTAGVLTSPFNITGSLGMPQIQVLPMEEISLEEAQTLMGNSLPRLARQGYMPSISDSNIVPMGESSDPFSMRAFDNKTVEKPVEPVQRKNGVTIVRGKPAK